MGRPRLRTRPWLVVSLGLSLALSVVGTGCKKKAAGDSCSPTQTTCQDKENALICVGGKLTVMQCRGSAGCSGSGETVSCDNKFASAGDGCSKETSDLACTMDKKGELRCRDNRLVLASSCRGPKGCWWEGSTLHCDTDTADLTDPCEDDDGLSCSTDAKALLKCTKGKYAVANTCKGPKGCRVDGTKVHCDDDLADVGDPCEAEQDYSCSMDKKQLLSCHGGQFKVERACKKECTSTDKDGKTTFDCR